MKISRGTSLDRYYLFKLFGFGLFLHRIHNSDPVNKFHTHPWNGISFILGEYFELRFGQCEYKRRRWVNFVKAKTPHRVFVFKPVWTLFFHWPKSNRWVIMDDEGNTIAEEPWEGDQGKKDYTQV